MRFSRKTKLIGLSAFVEDPVSSGDGYRKLLLRRISALMKQGEKITWALARRASFLTFLLLMVSLWFPFKTAFAQVETDYLFQYEEYRTAYNNFLVARDKYLKYKTLTARDEALEKTKKIILQRDEVLRTYFIALRTKITTATISPLTLKDETLKKIDEETKWLEQHKEKANNTPFANYQQLFSLSSELESKQLTIYKLIYQSLTLINLEKNQSLQQDTVFLWEALNDEVEASSGADLQGKLVPWLTATKEKNRLAEQQTNLSKDKLDELNKIEKLEELVKIYNQIESFLDTGIKYLKESFSYQKEIFSLLTNG